ncbi:MAG: hypothetical protein R2856_24895 [Caldilineaceae bacterium]
MTPVDPAQSTEWQENTAMLRFSCILRGIQGYAWDFPCYVAGRPFMNRGIFDSRIAPDHQQPVQHGALKNAFTAGLDQRHVDPASASTSKDTLCAGSTRAQSSPVRVSSWPVTRRASIRSSPKASPTPCNTASSSPR